MKHSIDILCHPHFICQRCATDHALEVDLFEGFPQQFVWDCERCCCAHDITVLPDGDDFIVRAECI